MFSWTDITGNEYVKGTLGSGNCNYQLPQWEEDYETITDMSQLPVMKVNYGPLMFKNQEAFIAVGPLHCNPKLNLENTDTNRISILQSECESRVNHVWVSSKCIFPEIYPMSIGDAISNCERNAVAGIRGKLYEPANSEENEKILSTTYDLFISKVDYVWMGLKFNGRNVEYITNENTIDFGNPVEIIDDGYVVGFLPGNDQWFALPSYDQGNNFKRPSLCEFS